MPTEQHRQNKNKNLTGQRAGTGGVTSCNFMKSGDTI
jgi:hypothetical protein